MHPDEFRSGTENGQSAASRAWGAAGHAIREGHGGARITDQQVERATAYRLRQRLGSKVGRADCVGLTDDVRAVLIASPPDPARWAVAIRLDGVSLGCTAC